MATTRKENHTLTTQDVLAIFDQAGLRRNQCSIARYCASGKLDCFREDDESGAAGRYDITPESAERLIGQLREIQARHQQHFAATPGQMESDPSDHVRPRPIISKSKDSRSAFRSSKQPSSSSKRSWRRRINSWRSIEKPRIGL